MCYQVKPITKGLVCKLKSTLQYVFSKGVWILPLWDVLVLLAYSILDYDIKPDWKKWVLTRLTSTHIFCKVSKVHPRDLSLLLSNMTGKVECLPLLVGARFGQQQPALLLNCAESTQRLSCLIVQNVPTRKRNSSRLYYQQRSWNQSVSWLISELIPSTLPIYAVNHLPNAPPF